MKTFINAINNFANPMIDFLTNTSSVRAVKYVAFIVRFCFMIFGIFVLVFLSISPLLRDLSTASNICYEKFLQNSENEITLESSQNLTNNIFTNNLQEQSEPQTLPKEHFLRVVSHSLDNRAEKIDLAFSDFLSSLSPFIAKKFGRFFMDSSELDSAFLQSTSTDFAIDSTHNNANLQNLISQKLIYNYTQISQPTYDTLYMVSISTLIAIIFGLPLGVLLCLTKKGRIFSSQGINSLVGSLVNVIRSFPFIILIILLLPLSRLIVGTSIGATAAIIPLSIAAIPFIARLFEGALDEVDKGLIEATLSLGASKFAVIKMMIAEAMPSICNAVVITIIGLIGYSAMGGAVGAGGLGDTAIRLGFQGYQPDILCSTVVVIIILVQCVQGIGDSFIAHLRRYR